MDRPKNQSRRPALLNLGVGLLIAALSFAAVWIARSAGGLRWLELGVYDAMLAGRAYEDGADSPVVVIGLEESDIRQMGHYPIHDGELAKVLSQLAQMGARAIGVDIFRDIHVGVDPGERATLTRVLLDHPQIIMVEKIDDVPPPPELDGPRQGKGRIGFIDLVRDYDGLIRRNLFALDDDDGEFHESLGLRLARLHLRGDGVKVAWDADGMLHLGEHTLDRFEGYDGAYIGEDDAGYTALFDFKGPRTFKRFTIGDVVHNRIKRADIDGKVVLVGVTAASLKDLVDTSITTGELGVVLHARAVDQFLRVAQRGDAPIAVWSDGAEAAWTALWATVGAAAALAVRTLGRLVLVNALAGGALIGGACIAFGAGLWLPLVPPVLALVAAAGAGTAFVSRREWQRRRVLKRLLDLHLSPEVAETIWRDRDRFLAGGRLRLQGATVTMLFTDMQGFSAISEEADPEQLMTWLNDYMETMADVVEQHGGYVSDYIGDAIMAVFGGPIVRTTDEEINRDAQNAVACAVTMRGKLAAMNERWKAQGRPTVRMRVGILTGKVAAGSLGSARRLKYTVIGNTVNMAARLESYEKDAALGDDIAADGCRILMGQPTRDRIGERFATRCVGNLELRNIKNPMPVHGVIGVNEEAAATTAA